jgi:protein Mpv17
VRQTHTLVVASRIGLAGRRGAAASPAASAASLGWLRALRRLQPHSDRQSVPLTFISAQCPSSAQPVAAMAARRLVSWYDGHLRAAPIRTKVFSSFTILTGADVVRQRLFEASPGVGVGGGGNGAGAGAKQLAGGWWDQDRTARMALFSCSLHPLWMHHWFNFMEFWRPSAPLSAPTAQILRAAGTKVLIDQLASAGAFHAVFLTTTTLMQGRSYAEVCAKLQRDWFTLVKASWSLWCVAHLVNFSVVPLHWRVVYSNVVSTGWAVFMSKMMSNEEGAPAILTPVDIAANAITGGVDGLPGGNGECSAVSCTVGLGLCSLFSTGRWRDCSPPTRCCCQPGCCCCQAAAAAGCWLRLRLTQACVRTCLQRLAAR